jgi:hypothetical protein
MGEYRYSDNLGQAWVDLLRAKLQRKRDETGDEVFLYQSMDGSIP